MIEEILNLEKVNRKSDINYIFNFSKIDNVHLQSPSLIKLGEQKDRQIHFKKLKRELNNNPYVESAELTENGFINITLNLVKIIKYLQKSKEELLETIKDSDPKKYVLDYGGPNIGKSMHVGHLRPLNIGRALYNIYNYSGNSCVSDIHLGDWGVPISQILTYCYEKNIKIKDLKVENLQEIYPKASKYSNEDVEFKSKVAENLAKLNKFDTDLYNDWNFVSQLTIQDIKKILSKLNHRFDLFHGESTVIDLIPKMINDLKDNNLVRIDNSALISNEKVEPPVLILSLIHI